MKKLWNSLPGSAFKRKSDILTLFVAAIPVWAAIIWTNQGRVWGYDGQFYLSFMFNHSPLIANLCVIAVWEAVLCLALWHGKQYPAALFMLNMANMRLLMPDPDAFIFILCSFVFLGFIFQRFGKITMSCLAVILTASVFLFWRIPLASVTAYGDLLPNPALFFAILPTYYMQIKQKQYIDALCLTWLIVLFPTGKFVMIALMPVLFGVFLRAKGIQLGLVGKLLVILSLCAYFMFPFIV